MSYYIDQLAEQDRQKRLADLLAMQQDNSEPGVQYDTPQQPMPQQGLLSDLMKSGVSRDEINAMLSQSTITSPGFNDASPPPQYEPGRGPAGMVEQAPMNTIRNNTTGAVTDLGPSRRSGPALDYSGAIEIPGVGKGYRLKGDATRAVMADGRIIDMGRDTGKERALMKEDLGIQKQRAELAQLQAKPQVESTYDKRMAELRAEDTAARQPGTAAYKRIQDEQLAKRKEGVKNAGTLKAAESSKQYSESVANEVDVAIAALFNTTPDKLPELFGSEAGMKKAEGQTKAATGSFDVLTPTIIQGTANVEERAKRLQSMAELMGLTNLRKAGVAPGSITEKEWPKFGAQLGNISLRMGDKEFADEMKRIWKTNQQLRGTGQMDLDDTMKDGGGGQATASAVQSVPKNSINHQETMFNAKKAIAKNPAVRDAVIAKMKSGGYDTSGL